MARLKKVFSNADQVIHLFAQRTQDEANSSNVFFEEGKRIYSYGYHYLLGEFVEKGGETVLFINDTGYSNTTSKHISTLRWGTRQYKQFFFTEVLPKHVKSKMDELLKKLAKARKPEKYISEAEYLYGKYNEFLEWNKGHGKVKKLGAAFRTTIALQDKQAHKEIERLITAIRSSDPSAELDNIEGARKRKKQRETAAARKAYAERLERERVENKARFEEGLAEFYNHERRYVRVEGYDKDYLRLSKDGEKVETTQGVTVSVKAARVLYALIQANKDVIGHVIEGYTVISKNGTLKIGCHNIDMDSVHKVGKLITK